MPINRGFDSSRDVFLEHSQNAAAEVALRVLAEGAGKIPYETILALGLSVESGSYSGISDPIRTSMSRNALKLAFGKKSAQVTKAYGAHSKSQLRGNSRR